MDSLGFVVGGLFRGLLFLDGFFFLGWFFLFLFFFLFGGIEVGLLIICFDFFLNKIWRNMNLLFEKERLKIVIDNSVRLMSVIFSFDFFFFLGLILL